MKNSFEKNRKEFGQLIRAKRREIYPSYNQDKFAKKVNALIESKHIFSFNQKKISRLELGDVSLKLTKDAIKALQKICKLQDDDIKPIMDELETDAADNKSIPNIIAYDKGNFIVDSKHPEFKSYLGDYHCVFFSTDSSVKKYVRALMNIYVDNQNSNCNVKLTIYEGNDEIKWYSGIFMINNYYNMWYCILIGDNKQEVCMLASAHSNHSIHNNFLNIALVITTSAGFQKRPTMHRMLLSRKKITGQKLSLLLSQLKLNNDTITISENKLRQLEQDVKKHIETCTTESTKAKYEALYAGIQLIYKLGKKETYYTIDESIIYDSKQLSQDTKTRGFIVSTMRQSTDNDYYNKVSQTIHDICADIIGK